MLLVTETLIAHEIIQHTESRAVHKAHLHIAAMLNYKDLKKSEIKEGIE